MIEKDTTLSELILVHWHKEFLLSLQQHQKWNQPQRNLVDNEIVIIKDDTLPRNCWQLARISQTDSVEDGPVHTVQVVANSAVSADGWRLGL